MPSDMNEPYEPIPTRPAPRQRYHLSVAYVVLLWSGLCGGHRIYLGLRRSGWAMFLLTLAGAALFYVGYRNRDVPGSKALLLSEAGVVVLCITLLWIIVDAIRLPSLVRRANAL